MRSIVRNTAGGLAFGDEAEGSAVDWVVTMRRFGRDALLEAMRQRQELPLALMPALAERIAWFHERAEPQPDFGGGKGIGNVVAGDVDVFLSMTGHPFLPRKLERLARLAWRPLEVLRRHCRRFSSAADARSGTCILGPGRRQRLGRRGFRQHAKPTTSAAFLEVQAALGTHTLPALR